jgi:DNA-binding transcriptional MerR regulator
VTQNTADAQRAAAVRGPGRETDWSTLLTIDELAGKVGMTVRTVRSHIGRGLLPPPHLRGRTAYYDTEHVARLRLVATLQDEGFNLAAIDRLVHATPAESAEQVLTFHRALVTPWLDEPSLEMTYDDLARLSATPVDEDALATLAEHGLVEDLGDGRVRVPNPALFRAGAQVVRLGVPPAAVLAVEPDVRCHARAVAETFVRMFRDTVYRDMSEAGLRPDDVAAADTLVRQLQPVAAQALLAAFQQEMTTAIRSALRDEWQRLRALPDDQAG